MNEIQLREAMRLVERPVALPAEFTDRVFEAMVVELETEAVPATAPVTRPAKAPRGRGWSIPWRPMIAIAAAIGIIFGVVSVLSVAKAPSALAALRDARQRFEKVPQYHARTAVATNDDASNPDFEMTWETEDWYQDESHWRTTIVSSKPVPSGGPGDYRVMTPELFGAYNARANVFTARPAGEDDAARLMNPSFFFDPSLQWWSTGEEGERGKPSDQFFEENCAVSETTIIGRAATKLTCESKPRDIELWLDDATGMLLKIEWFDITREITSLALDPEFPAGAFDATAPEGAKKRWAGEGEPPPEYAVKLGVEVAARYPIVEGRVQGLWIAETTETELWVIAIRCTTRCDTELLRVDQRTGAVAATVRPPPERRIEGLALVGDDMWAALMHDTMETPTPASFVQRLDLTTNEFVGEAIETGTVGADVGFAAGAMWSTGGQSRFVKFGRAESHYNGLARIDPATGAVTHIDLDASAGSLAVVGDTLWVQTSAIDRRDPEQSLFELVEVDAKTGSIGRRVRVPGWPNAPVTDGQRIYTLFGDESQQWHVGVVDVASGTFSSTPVGPPNSQFGTLTVAGDHVWLMDLGTGGVIKLDAKTLQPLATIGTGPDPGGIAVANGSVWVTHAGDGSLVRIDIE